MWDKSQMWNSIFHRRFFDLTVVESLSTTIRSSLFSFLATSYFIILFFKWKYSRMNIFTPMQTSKKMSDKESTQWIAPRGIHQFIATLWYFMVIFFTHHCSTYISEPSYITVISTHPYWRASIELFRSPLKHEHKAIFASVIHSFVCCSAHII